MKVALLHDYLIRFGGAERVLKVLSGLFPEAPIYTLLFEEDIVRTHFPGAIIRPSFLQSAPRIARSRHRLFAPLYPVAVETLALRDFDLVISSCSAFVKGVIVRPQTFHISYIHAPSRFLWDWASEYRETLGGPERLLARPLVHYLRVWDRRAGERPDFLIANSGVTRDKIKKYYRRDSEVIYPPVSTVHKKPPITNRPNDNRGAGRNKQFYLIVSYLAPYKWVHVAVEAFNKLELPLVIVGDGPELEYLKKIAQPNIVFVGFRSDRFVEECLRECRAFIFSGEDDFGMTAVEAMSWGKPVLAYRGGGVTESVIEGVTGEFFDDPVPEVLADGVRRLNEKYGSYDPVVIKKRAEEFSEEIFVEKMKAVINRVTSKK